MHSLMNLTANWKAAHVTNKLLPTRVMLTEGYCHRNVLGHTEEYRSYICFKSMIKVSIINYLLLRLSG